MKKKAERKREQGTYETSYGVVEKYSYVFFKIEIVFKIQEGPSHITEAITKTWSLKKLSFLESNISPAVQIYDQLTIHFHDHIGVAYRYVSMLNYVWVRLPVREMLLKPLD